MATGGDGPALFQRPGMATDFRGAQIESAELLHSAGFFDSVERALVDFEGSASKAREIAADKDLTSEGRLRRAQPVLEAAEREARAALEAEVAKIEAARLRAQADVDGSSRPPSPASIESVTHGLRVVDCRRELAGLTPGERVQVVLSAAQAGDVIPILAAEQAYVSLVPSDVLTQARRALGAALNKPASEAVRIGGEKLEIARRFSEIAQAQISQSLRGILGGLSK